MLGVDVEADQDLSAPAREIDLDGLKEVVLRCPACACWHMSQTKPLSPLATGGAAFSPTVQS